MNKGTMNKEVADLKETENQNELKAIKEELVAIKQQMSTFWMADSIRNISISSSSGASMLSGSTLHSEVETLKHKNPETCGNASVWDVDNSSEANTMHKPESPDKTSKTTLNETPNKVAQLEMMIKMLFCKIEQTETSQKLSNANFRTLEAKLRASETKYELLETNLKMFMTNQNQLKTGSYNVLKQNIDLLEQRKPNRETCVATEAGDMRVEESTNDSKKGTENLWQKLKDIEKKQGELEKNLSNNNQEIENCLSKISTGDQIKKLEMSVLVQEMKDLDSNLVMKIKQVVLATKKYVDIAIKTRTLTTEQRNQVSQSLEEASKCGNLFSIQYALDTGADIETRFKSHRYARPLIIAAQNGKKEAIETLLCNLIDVDATDNQHHTALWHAAKLGHYDIVKRLLDHGADIDLSGHDNKTSLTIASENGHASTVDLLLQERAEITKANSGMTTLLCCAACKGHNKVIEHLLEHGLDINEKDSYGTTPLMKAIEYGNASTVNLLLQKGADINKSNSNKKPLLFTAAQNGFDAIIDILLNYGVNIEEQNNDGQTPLMRACSRHQVSTVKLLLERGAKIETKDKDGKSAFDHTYTNNEILRILHNWPN